MEQANGLLNEYLMRLATQKASVNLVKGQHFLAENAKKEGVVTLPSGLQYKVIKAGEGSSPVDTSSVTVHYTGTFIDGKVFDSSVERGEPAEFGVNDVIPGWTEALKLMKPGANWMLYIPSNLAYGENSPAGIEPNSVMIFDVQLISVK
jgi:FKBP-type peptidyl-prolyl cis-trans isomerase FklB